MLNFFFFFAIFPYKYMKIIYTVFVFFPAYVTSNQLKGIINTL